MGMRITNGMIVNRFLHNLNGNNSRMNKIQMQIGADRRVLRLSDDPVGITKILTARSRIADVNQYERNIRDAGSLLTSSESAMEDINATLIRLTELAVQAANEVLTESDRNAIASEIGQLRDHILTALNSSISGRFLFGGHNVTSPPYTIHDREQAVDMVQQLYPDGSPMLDGDGDPIFSPVPRTDPQNRALDANENLVFDDRGNRLHDIWYNRVEHPPGSGVIVAGINMNHAAFQQQRDDAAFPLEWAEYDRLMAQELNFMLGYSVDLPVNVVGLNLSGFGPTNIYTVVDNFFRVMNSPDFADFETAQGFIGEMQRLQSQTLTQMADLGGRANRLEFIMDRYSIDKINYEQMLADVEGLDLAEAITRLSFAEATYRASLGIGGRILQPSLLDFLR
jgi:flagellar hook-associated protein 3 FlgL